MQPMLENQVVSFYATACFKTHCTLAMHKQEKVNKIYDPAAGSGSLLLQAKNISTIILLKKVFGQEVNHTTYNLARMNMFYTTSITTSLILPLVIHSLTHIMAMKNHFDAIVSNPPYSIKWIGDDDPTLINDDRFAPAGVLAPKSKQILLLYSCPSYLSKQRQSSYCLFPGIILPWRCRTENQKIFGG